MPPPDARTPIRNRHGQSWSTTGPDADTQRPHEMGARTACHTDGASCWRMLPLHGWENRQRLHNRQAFASGGSDGCLTLRRGTQQVTQHANSEGQHNNEQSTTPPHTRRSAGSVGRPNTPPTCPNNVDMGVRCAIPPPKTSARAYNTTCQEYGREGKHTIGPCVHLR